MPTLELGDLQDPRAVLNAKIAVASVMNWPDDEEARNGYKATVWADQCGELERQRNSLPHSATRQEVPDALLPWGIWLYADDWVKERFHEVGGFTAVANARGLQVYNQDINARASDWLTTGLILGLIFRMAVNHPDLRGGASVNKALHLVEQLKLPQLPHNRKDLLKAWKRYKPVAHFCAAFFYIFNEARAEKPDGVAAEVERRLQSEFPTFIAVADAYQRFGRSYAAASSRQPLLDPEKTWLLPPERTWPAIEFVPTPLDSRLLELARGYAAPTGGV